MNPTLKGGSFSGGHHYTFEHSEASLAFQKKIGKAYISESGPNGEIWSLRMHNAYVLGPGSSVTKDGVTGEYKILWDAPIVKIPDTLLQFLIERYNAQESKKSTSKDNSGPVSEGGRNKYLTSRAGKLRQDGLEYEEILAVLTRINSEMCQPLLPDSEVETISRSVSRYEIGNDGTVFSSAASQTEVPTDWNTCFKAVKELEAGDVRMMINNFLPEGTTFVGALPGEGKTFLGLSIAKALTRQEDFLGNYNFEVPEKIPVIYMIPESGSRAFRKRCEKFNIPNDRKLFLCRTISEGSTLRLSDPLLIEAVKEMKPVVILDTLVRFSESDDENAAMQNRQLANDITVLRQMGAVAVVGLHHATKGMREKGMSLETVLRGSGDIAAYADAVYGMLRDNNLYDRGNGPNEIDIACVKPRDFDPPLPFRIAASQRTNDKTIGQAPGIRSLIDLDGDFRIVQMADVQAKRGAELVRLITEDPAITLPELEKATGQSTWVIRKSLKGLGWAKQKGGSKGGHVWIKKADLINLDSPIKSEN
jgi:hypothetical protein